MNFLTFDIEEWFHIPGYQVDSRHWDKYEYRAEVIVDMILSLLDEKKTKATFMVLGWFAREQPHVLRKIDDAGHLIGSHSDLHDLVYEMQRNTFRNDLERSIYSISEVTGKPVSVYRAPSFSVKMNSIGWFFDELINVGIKYDLSIFPAARIRGGLPGMPSKPFVYRNEKGCLYELPINIVNFFGLGWVYSGGGYFRLLPYCILRYLFSTSSYNMTYFHPHDFDVNKALPENMNLVSRWRRRCGVASLFVKMNRLLDEFEFSSVEGVLQSIEFKELNESFYDSYT